MRWFKKLTVLVLFSLLFTEAKATHIVGGELYYDYLGNNDYLVTLKVYRDCINGQAPFDNPASVGVYDVNGNLIQNLQLSLPGFTTLPVSLNNPCYQPPGGVCVEEAIYITTVNLPPIPGGYTLCYQRCCRNATILNLNNPLSVGSTFSCTIPGTGVAPGNSNPRYDSLPPLFMCANVPFSFLHSATDPDGDLLVYTFCDPYDGGSQTNPMPSPPTPPPFMAVPWLNPYSANYPINSNPAMNINQNTGLITGTPNQVGQWVFAVCVEEWRNNQLISTSRREYQVNVTLCPNLSISSIPSQTTFCFGYTVNFSNNSINASSYFWDFNDPNATNDTSNLATPTWTYTDSGTYNVMLICNPGMSCADTAYTTFYIYPLLSPNFVPPNAQCINNNNFNFTAAGNFMGNGVSTFAWNFGNNANPQNSSAQNPNNVQFTSTGWHTVTLTVSENNCTQTYTDSIYIYPMPTASFNAAPQNGCAPFTAFFTNTSVTGNMITNYSWNFGDGNTSNLASPTHIYNQPGNYTVTLTVITSNGCIDTLTFVANNIIDVYPVPTAIYDASPLVTSIFNPDVTFMDLSQGGTSCTIYFGDGNYSNNCNSSYTYQAPGIYNSYQVVTNTYGCADTFSISIEIKYEYRFFVPNAFTPNNSGFNDVFMPKVMGAGNYHFMIFDRWGQLFFETYDPNQGWDGTYKGNKCQQDVYVWKVELLDLAEKIDRQYIGHVTLIR